MSDINDGGPAFPLPVGIDHPQGNGMSLRDYFATEAMRRIHAANLAAQGISTASNYPEIAREAYELADAMLAARDRKAGA